MKTAIIYYSKHHGNTKKVLDAIKMKYADVTLINVLEQENVDLSEYDLVGLASGIYYSKFHKFMLKFAEQNLKNGTKVFFIYTYGVEKQGYTDAIRVVAEGKGAYVIGEYGCLGFNTFGPFKLIGGIAKGHPNDNELEGGIDFYQNLLKME